MASDGVRMELDVFEVLLRGFARVLEAAAEAYDRGRPVSLLAERVAEEEATLTVVVAGLPIGGLFGVPAVMVIACGEAFLEYIGQGASLGGWETWPEYPMWTRAKEEAAAG